MSRRVWESTVFRTDEEGLWLLFGHPIKGFWLPDIGFNSLIEYDDVLLPTEKIIISFFKAEFLGHGYAFIYKVQLKPMMR